MARRSTTDSSAGTAASRGAGAAGLYASRGSEQAIQRALDWFEQQEWEPFHFQVDVWRAYLEGKSGLIHSATGTGKTFAAYFGPLLEAGEASAKGLRVLWITPLRALAADTEASLRYPLPGMGLDWRVEGRTGDTSAAAKARQATQMPQALVTTPESLSLMLADPEARGRFGDLRCVIVDEWHELMASKRGVQTELCLARLRAFRPDLRIWGLSATLGNLEQAMQTLLGLGHSGILVKGDVPKEIIIDSVLPETLDRFPWAGHLGVQMIPRVVEAIAEVQRPLPPTSSAGQSAAQGEGAELAACLVFCNTRAQAEIWYQNIIEARPDWRNEVALHHGSLDREVREAVEEGLKQGRLRAVVCTSSLDLGVDFTPVERVLQVGSPKSVARLLQRAGRSGHRPGVPSRVTCVPTHALEMVDIAAARYAAEQGRIEAREGIEKPLDLLSQHLVTVAVGEGFRDDEMLEEVRGTYAYRNLSQEEWKWTLQFITRGGESLRAYPEYHRVVVRDGVFRVEDKDIAQRHRMSIGTIVADAALTVQFLKGHRLGTVEESFLSRLKPGDKFIFSGRPLQFLRIKDMTAWVKPAKDTAGAVPRWMGGRLALSGELAHAIREKLQDAGEGLLESPEMRMLAPILEIQSRWSAIPELDELLIERVETKEGHHLFFYPMEGRLVHQGLGALFAYRLSRLTPITFTMACNDYGFELLADRPAPLEEALDGGLLSAANLAHDIPASLNAVEMARRQFREIARISGLVFEGFPGMRKRMKQIQASSGLFYDVFLKYEPSNMLLHQAEREVLERQLEQSRLARALDRLSGSRVVLTEPPRPTPIAFPIIVDRFRETVTSEAAGDRIQRMSLQLTEEAEGYSSLPRPKSGARHHETEPSG